MQKKNKSKSSLIFVWKDYSADYAEKVEGLFDAEAIRFTGCDEGFGTFCEYWLSELGAEAFFSKVVFIGERLIGVVALAVSDDGVFTLQEIAVTPEERGNGYGSMMLRELLTYSRLIIGREIEEAEAVIFPKNIASQRAFQNAGFIHIGTHPDGDAFYYGYKRRDVQKHIST